MKCAPLLLVICLGIHGELLAQVMINRAATYSVDGNVKILKEDSMQLSAEKAYEKFLSNEFQSITSPNNEVNLGQVRDVYWLALPIQNTRDSLRKLEIGINNGGIFTLSCWFIDIATGKTLQHFITGDHFDFYSRPMHHRYFYAPLHLKAFQKVVVLYRIDMKGTGFYIPFRLADEAISRQEEKNIYLFYAFFSGWLSFVVLFGLLTLVLTRERVYLWYSLYVLSYCLFFIADGDLDFEWFYPHWPALATITPIVYGLMINFFMLLFMGNFLFLKKSHPRIFMISKIWLGIILIELALIIVGFNYSDNISLRTFVYYFGLITVLGSWLLQITGILRRISDGYRPAYLYGIALLSVFASAILYIIHALGVGSSLIPSYLYVPIGFALEIVILAFALIYSSNFYKNKHQELTLRIATQQRDFSNQLLSVQESEQKRIAHDLHDEVGSMIAAIKITLGTLPLTADKRPVVLQMMDRLSLSTRNIAHNLMPPEFESTKLTQLLSSFYDHLNSQNNLKFNFYVSGKSEYFNKHDELVIYRIIMEITNNIIRHAEAKEATIQLIYSEFNLQIIAEDDGKGFDPGTLGGFGLRSIQSRVNFMQGTINIDSGQYGTSIVITLPFIKSE